MTYSRLLYVPWITAYRLTDYARRLRVSNIINNYLEISLS